MKTIVWRLFVLSDDHGGTLGVAEAKAQVQVQLKLRLPSSQATPLFRVAVTRSSSSKMIPQLFEIRDESHSHVALLSVEIIDSEGLRTKSEMIFNKYGTRLC